MSLSSGVTFVDHGNGTGTLSGTPAGGIAFDPLTVGSTTVSTTILNFVTTTAAPVTVTS